MRQAFVFIAIGIVAGIGMATLFGTGAPPAVFPERLPETAAARRDELAARVAALEAALADESLRHAALEDTVTALGEQVGSIDSAAVIPREDFGDAETLAAASESQPTPRAVVAARRELASPERRLQRLIEAGFSAERAQWLLDRDSQRRMDMINAQYEARREGQPFDPLTGLLAGQAELRAELGDDSYARYLEALGRSTRVAVLEVLEGSPAQAAGLQPGDEILSYAGRRVFSLAELNQLTLEGSPGEPVAVDVLRDGQPVQLYLPRGPVGISGGGRRLRAGAGIFVP